MARPPRQRPELDAELLSAIMLSRRPGVGAKRFKALIEAHERPSRALAAFEELPGLSSDKAPLTAGQLAGLEGLPRRVGATWYGAPDYPRRLGTLAEPPPYLFHEGPLWPPPLAAVAIVGPRRCSPAGAGFARSIAEALAAAGVCVISGGALGVDHAAHQGTLAAGGETLLVAATGIDRCYPESSAPLFRAVARRGCLLTELLPGTPPRRDFFPTRNRIIVGLAAAIVVVEGQPSSGTASSARHAARLGRPIFAFSSASGRSQSLLTRRLIEERGASRLTGPDPTPLLQLLERGQRERGREQVDS